MGAEFSTVYWWMLPVSVCVSTVAMTLGVGGAVVFSPIFILVFPLVGVPVLSPSDAFGAALLTTLVGFSSGMLGYRAKGLIDFRTGLEVLSVGGPMGIVGALVKTHLPASVLLVAFSVGMFALASYVSHSRWTRAKQAVVCSKQNPARGVAKHDVQRESAEGDVELTSASRAETHQIRVNSGGRQSAGQGHDLPGVVVEWAGEDERNSSDSDSRCNVCLPTTGADSAQRKLIDARGNTYEYEVNHSLPGLLLIAVGCLMTGVVSVGVGETTVTTMRIRYRMPMRVSSGTSVFVVAIVLFLAAGTQILQEGVDSVPWNLVAFTMPGVLIGGQVAPYVSSRVSSSAAELVLICMFVLLGCIIGYIAIMKVLESVPSSNGINAPNLTAT